jgi:hypothetical protein
MKSEKDLDMQLDLEEYFRFTPEDLAQNKKGVVSGNQKKELFRRKLDWIFRRLILVGLIVAGFFIILLFNHALFILSALWPYAIVILAVIVGGLISPVLKKQDMTLKSVEGKVRLERVTKKVWDESRTKANRDFHDPAQTRLDSHINMNIGGQVFLADPKFQEIIHSGDTCRVYYVGENDIISMEVFD